MWAGPRGLQPPPHLRGSDAPSYPAGPSFPVSPAAQAQASRARQASAAPRSLHEPGPAAPPGPAPQALQPHLPGARRTHRLLRHGAGQPRGSPQQRVRGGRGAGASGPCGPALRPRASRPAQVQVQAGPGGPGNGVQEGAGRWEDVLKAGLGRAAKVFRVDAGLRVRVRGLRSHGGDRGSAGQGPFSGPRSVSLPSPCSHWARPPLRQPPPLLRGNEAFTSALPQRSLHFGLCPSHPVRATYTPFCAMNLGSSRHPVSLVGTWACPALAPYPPFHSPTILKRRALGVPGVISDELRGGGTCMPLLHTLPLPTSTPPTSLQSVQVSVPVQGCL